MLSCLTIAPSDKGGDCGPLLRIVPEDAAKSGRRSDEDWAVVWGSGGWHPADIVCAAPGVVRAEAIDSVCSSGSSGCVGRHLRQDESGALPMTLPRLYQGG